MPKGTRPGHCCPRCRAVYDTTEAADDCRGTGTTESDTDTDTNADTE